jgi:hypothetical protein
LAETHCIHCSDVRYPDGEPLPVPLEVWDVLESEIRPPESPERPGQTIRHRYALCIDEADIERFDAPRGERGPIGIVRHPLVPLKVDEWDEIARDWATIWVQWEDIPPRQTP